MKRLLLARDPRDRPLESTLEHEWLEALAPFGITGLVRQYVVETEDGPKRIDLARPRTKTGLEFESRLWHSSEEDYNATNRKRYLLAKLGWLILPVTEFDLHERAAEVAADFDSLGRELMGACAPAASSWAHERRQATLTRR